MSVVFLWLATRRVDFHAAWGATRNTSLGWLVVGVVLINAALVPMAVRWKIATEGIVDRPPPVGSFLQVVVCSQAANNVVPARPGDILRVLWLGRVSGVGAASAAASMLADRALDVLALCLVIAVGFPFVRHETWVLGVGIAGLAGCLVLIGLWAWCRHLADRRVAGAPTPETGPIRRQLSRFSLAFGGLLTARRAVRMAAWTAVLWAIWAVGAWAIAQAMDLNLTPLQVLFATAVLNVGLAIPSSPGFVGTYQWLIINALALFAIGRDQAFAYAIVQQLAWFVPQTLVGLILLPRVGMSLGRLRSAATDDAVLPEGTRAPEGRTHE